MENEFRAQEKIWIQKLLLYTTLFHVFVLWLYSGYNIYLHFNRSSSYLYGSHLIYASLTLWVSLIFSWFMIQGISSLNHYHLRFAILSITLISLYILWWYLYPLLHSMIHRLNDPLIEIIIWINAVLCLEYYVVYIRYIFNQNTKLTLSTSNLKKKRTSDIYQKCVPVLLIDNEICTMYFACCIYQFLMDQDPIEFTAFCILCLVVQWIIVYVGYKVMNRKDSKCTIGLFIAYWFLFFLTYIPSITYLIIHPRNMILTQYNTWHMFMFGQFILLPLFVFITRISSIYWLYQSYKYFTQRAQHKQEKTVDKSSTSDNDHHANAVYKHSADNKSDSSNVRNQYVPPMQTIRQLSGLETSCNESPNVCNSKEKANISNLIQICSDFGDSDRSKYYKMTSGSINHWYENEDEVDFATNYCNKSLSKLTEDTTLLQQCWDHYMEYHPNMNIRHKTCSLSHKCLWSQHVRKHKEHLEQHHKHQLLAFCVTNKQLYHVYFYHSVDYDLCRTKDRRNERYIESHEDLNEIQDSFEINRASSMPTIEFDDDETQNGEIPEPGTPFIENDEYLNISDNITSTKDALAMNIEMTTMNECAHNEEDADAKCEMIQKLLDYGSAANCNKPDHQQQHVYETVDGPDIIAHEDHKEEDELIQLYLHCITHHSDYKRRCDDSDACGFNEWQNNQQQTMRQMIHCEFYRHTIIEIVIGDIFNLNDEEENTPIPEEEESDINIEDNENEEEFKYEEDHNKFALLKPIVYLPTMMEIMKSKSKTKSASQQSHVYDLNILQFGHPFTAKAAQFSNPKEEILNNEFYSINSRNWNNLLKKCVSLSRTTKAKHNKLTLRQLVALKLYTDFDDLQRELRKCFRRGSCSDEDIHKRQRQFYHWNELLENACAQSNDIITTRIYHGVNKPLMPSSFSGTYYGPISTTTMFDIAKQFAGCNGRILELYPSFSKRGLRVSWLSNFPDEDEVLYMNASFQIVNIYTNEQATNMYRSPFDEAPIIYERSNYYTDDEEAVSSSMCSEAAADKIVTSSRSFEEEEEKEKKMNHKINKNNVYKILSFERSIMKAIQMINVDSYIISFNATEIDEDSVFDAGFTRLAEDEQIAVLYLLYLQYKKNEWKEFLNSTPQHIGLAIGRYRDQFITLANNVQAVKMERASTLMVEFFAKVDEKEYVFPPWPKSIKMDASSDLKRVFKIWLNNNDRHNFINLSTFCKLFPNCKQVKINGDNFDWTLDGMIDFLCKYNLNYSCIALQDIYLRFADNNHNYDDIEFCEKQAKKRIRDSNLSEAKLEKLLKLGWKFVSGTKCHLHRYGFKPHPQLPFLSLFANNFNIIKYHKDIIQQTLSYSKSATKTRSSAAAAAAKRIHMIRKSMTNKSNKSNKSKSKSVFDQSRNSTLKTSRYSSEGQTMRLAWSRTSSYNNSSVNEVIEGCYITIVDYNPKVCDLSRNVFDKHSAEHQAEIVSLLQSVKNENNQNKKFANLCRKIERLVLDPIPDELKPIFIDKSNTKQKREIISFESILKIFPNVQDLFLRDTRFSLRIWYNLLKTIRKHEENKMRGPPFVNSAAVQWTLSRIFFSKQYFANHQLKTMEKTMNLRFKPHGWMFEPNEQLIFYTKLTK